MTSEALASYLAEARWFGGKGRDFEVTGAEQLDLGPGVSTYLVAVSYGDGGTDLYQVPVSSYDEPQERLGHALIGTWEGAHHYDAVHDREAMDLWLRSFAGRPDAGLDARLDFRRTDDHELDTDAHSTLFSGEQSNSSMAFGEDALLKVFRRLSPGTNPDIEVHEALTRAGSTHVAQLHGYLALRPAEGGEELDLAMLQQFLRTASDGWELALASARNLFTAEEATAEDAGGDFAAEAHRLGATLAEVHAVLAETFGTSEVSAAETVATMAGRLSAAVPVVNELEPLAAALTARFEALGELGTLEVQRVHGDLHLGQTLRTSLAWKLVDFEGEPAKDLAERRLPDSPWRDVAGMIRSFDYAAATVANDLGLADDGTWTT
ncbi:MAG: maltokinase N-terminal cap-like domain-containing protein, partial [Marmoricola sp.]